MEVTRIVSITLTVLLLSHMLFANPTGARDDLDISALEDDVSSVVEDVIRLLRDTRSERSSISEDEDRRVRRFIHFSIANDHKHSQRPRRRRIHHDRQQSRGGVRVLRV